MTHRDGPNLCIVQPNRPSPSETFLRAHAEHLPARVTVVHGDLGVPMIGDRPIRSRAIPCRAWRKALRIARGQGWEAELTSTYLKAFRRLRPAAVLAEYGPIGVDVAEACRRAGVPLIVHFHGYDASLRACLEEMAGPYRRMFGAASAIVAVSRAMRDRLVALGAPPEKVRWNPYGVDCGAFAGADPAAAPPTFLAVGRFTAKKAPDLTLRAFAEVRRAVPGARLRMVGFGPLQDACVGLAGTLGIAGAVTFLGACPPAMVQEEMRRARGFVQHSLEAADGDSEGTPVAILEAGASGLPVVSTRHAGIPDVVVEGRTGILVDERDVDGMAAGMIRLADDPALAGRMGRAARARIEAEFDLSDRIGRLWEIIAACIPPAAGPPAGRARATPTGASGGVAR